MTTTAAPSEPGSVCGRVKARSVRHYLETQGCNQLETTSSGHGQATSVQVNKDGRVTPAVDDHAKPVAQAVPPIGVEPWPRDKRQTGTRPGTASDLAR